MKKRLVGHLRGMLLKRERTPFERYIIGTVAFFCPDKLRRLESGLKELLAKRRVAILSPSDSDPDLYRRLQWADHWVTYELTKVLGELGYLVVDVDCNPDAVIHFFGKPTELPPNAYKIIWIYSHPDTVDEHLLRRYDRIYCLSSQFAQKIQNMGFEVETMWGATSKRPHTNDIKYDVVFVGNAHTNGRRQVVDDVDMPNYSFKVWGRGYRYLPKRYWAGEYFDYVNLSDLYSSSLITLNDHAAAMTTEGFVSIRIFDILASGGFCISDANPGINEIFGDAVPQYRSASELRELIDFYIQNPNERLKHMQRGQEIALSNSWRKRASQFMQGISAIFREN